MTGIDGYSFVIWDFDGTIADSMGPWSRAAANYLRARGFANADDIDHIIRPKGLMETAACMKRHFGLQETPQQIFDGIYEYMHGLYRDAIPFKPGVDVVLKQLRERGLRMCIATTTDRGAALSALRRWGMEDYFEFIITCDEVGADKFSPLIYLRAAQRLQAQPCQTIVVEDGVPGARAAMRAGFFVIGVRDDCFEDRQAHLKENCHIYLEDFSAWPREGDFLAAAAKKAE